MADVYLGYLEGPGGFVKPVAIKRMKPALAKVEEDSYGRCDVCGQPIGDARLEALPWATLCVKDAGRR